MPDFSFSLRALAGSLLLALPAAAQSYQPAPAVTTALEQVEPAAIKAHIQFLADDRLQGRQPGMPGYQLAVDYVTQQLKSFGVKPAGDKGSFVQRVRLRRAVVQAGNTLSLQTSGQGNTPLTAGQDYVFYPNPAAPSVQVEAPLAFAGYGITAPALQYDDYAGLDVKGKLVVVLRGAPRSFPSTVAAASQDLLLIMQNAAEHGAVGVVVATTNPKAKVSNLQRGAYSVLDAQSQVAASRTFLPGGALQLVASVSADVLQNLLRTAATDTSQVLAALRQSRPAPVALPVRMQARFATTYRDFDSYNVVGQIRGSDKRLRREYVVHSAHLDHLGVAAPVQGDSIYNGAHDNASGVASVLEIARTYSRLKQKPKRSILLVLQTGEELGLLGSAYFASHPTVPKASIVADVNTDMPTIIAPLLSVVPLGAQHSSLAGPVAQAAGALGLTVEADPEPEQNRFIRSDQYSFVMQGIPALHIKYGNRTADGRNNLSELVQKWRAVTYHKPQDDINGLFDFEAGKKYVQLNFLIGYLVANDAQRPTWNANDFFGQRFGPK
ncbi:M20/M25/M40 family metallo-hydrolase [Hymenobacter lutimineralis]|uniref:M20/M25/M40 family metallo-hydrolase n=1 Tax=Hymenobacter lutimineralis TaxID=2606448 RepID=A0A5D6UV25_9BACT|nr:M28 family peptidase [Hymenobacter lutimineralis]TYZ07416.1 M20/M25/M40 family metallo-hydrolase [Hymenobacter lutimineralis]